MKIFTLNKMLFFFVPFASLVFFLLSCSGEDGVVRGITQPELFSPKNNALVLDNLSVKLEWKNANSVGLTGPIVYTIYLDETELPFTHVGTSRIPSLELTKDMIENFDYNKTYYWRVDASADGVTESSDKISSFSFKKTIDLEKEALTEIYTSLNGDGWSNKTYWLSENPINTWHGVVTNDKGYVTELNLSNNNLSGQIPGKIENLKYLKLLDFSYNDFNTPIPKEIGSIERLEKLILSNAKLTETIPSELGKLAALKELKLNDNSLIRVIPKELGNLKQLELLDLGYNDLNGSIPDQLANLRKLKILSLTSNSLTGEIPKTIANIRSLKQFLVGQNNLMGSLPDFSESYLSTCQGDGCQDLFLWVNENKLTGSLINSGFCKENQNINIDIRGENNSITPCP